MSGLLSAVVSIIVLKRRSPVCTKTWKAHGRVQYIRRKATEIFADWREELPRMRYLHEAESVFQHACGRRGDEAKMEEHQRTLVRAAKRILYD
ncbi:MAG: hypothetical protein JW883_13720 [Deltaproteobacteria bacterium]|nr:hypothetical protein [Deltaproteobacteria bacterium]